MCLQRKMSVLLWFRLAAGRILFLTKMTYFKLERIHTNFLILEYIITACSLLVHILTLDYFLMKS